MERIKALIATATGAFMSTFGLLAIPLALLVACQVVDYTTGIMASHYIGEKVSSQRSYKGIFKKVSMYFLVFVGFALDCLLSYGAENLGIGLPLVGIVASIVAVWLVINELISIAENCEKMELNVPFLKPLLVLVKGKVEEKVEQN